MANSLKRGSFTRTPITQKAAKGQKKTHQGGYAFTVDDMKRAERFLILGSEASFYQSGAQMSLENAKTIRKIAKTAQATELIDKIVEVSEAGRAPKQSPGLFALALIIAETEDDAVRTYAYARLNDVARTASTLFEFAGYLAQFSKATGMGFRKSL